MFRLHIAHLRQQCHKMCDFSGEIFKSFEMLQFSMSATTTQLLSSGQFCKMRYETTPVKSASANVSFYTNNSKIAKILICDTLVANERCDAVQSYTNIYVNTQLFLFLMQLFFCQAQNKVALKKE